jgi:DNA-binding NarL/FixJ family response regulator
MIGLVASVSRGALDQKDRAPAKGTSRVTGRHGFCTVPRRCFAALHVQAEMTQAITTVQLPGPTPVAHETARILEVLLVGGAALISFPESDIATDVMAIWNEDVRNALAAEAETKRDCPLVLVCERFEPTPLSALFAAGICGAALRADAARTLTATIAAVSLGHLCFPRHQGLATARPVLSIREKQVLGLVALGLANSEIADRLVVTESTVKSHLTSAFSKLGVRSRHEAAHLVVNPESGLGLGFLSLVPEAENGADG